MITTSADRIYTLCNIIIENNKFVFDRVAEGLGSFKAGFKAVFFLSFYVKKKKKKKKGRSKSSKFHPERRAELFCCGKTLPILEIWISFPCFRF